jgi:hypothetical protein
MDFVVRWNEEKNEWLRLNRRLSFEQVADAIALGEIVDDIPNPSSARGHQRLLIVRIGKRHVAAPYVTDGEVKFLKTMYYSRDLDEKYGGERG